VAVTFTRDRGGSSENPCVRIYACWSRLGPPICLGRGPANGAGPPLAIVVCSLLLLSLFRTNIELIRMSSIIRQTFFAVFERSSSPSLPLCVRSCSYRYYLSSKLSQYLSPLFSSHFPLQYLSIHPSLKFSSTPDPAGDYLCGSCSAVLDTLPPLRSGHSLTRQRIVI
jgi:hypothetical protein